ncbi:hypothetical protein [Thiospirillum jenense]|uniref:Uncharacterized protein n=1 Tax=Thiospirillum jenense TaxID=1653858 RepID=A0A839HC88_9GAMM|nr:hypothetical protein [Thiospirillum jenense]MBB1126563.1 hypothetical protein [Thiospirillum jenense]
MINPLILTTTCIAVSITPLTLIAAERLLYADGQDVGYQPAPDAGRDFAMFQTERDELHTVYLLNCRTKQFLWTKGFNTRTGERIQSTANAQWQPLNNTSTIANAVYHAICPQLLNPVVKQNPPVTPAPIVNEPPPAAIEPAPAANTPQDDLPSATEVATYDGLLTIGEPRSSIAVLSAGSGDLMLFVFNTASPVGERIRAVCQNRKGCQFTGTIRWLETIPPVEDSGNASAAAEIMAVSAVKPMAF